ncbi:hypothetical protein TRVL_08439 [Trypanosoma vivax]|nr:hypothetical protein TRVL_08439 [Trypanosoma vivax]
MALPTVCGAVVFGRARGLSQPRSPRCFEALRDDGAACGIFRGAPLGKEGNQPKRRRGARRPYTQNRWRRVLRDWRLFTAPALSFRFPSKQPKEQSGAANALRARMRLSASKESLLIQALLAVCSGIVPHKNT